LPISAFRDTKELDGTTGTFLIFFTDSGKGVGQARKTGPGSILVTSALAFPGFAAMDSGGGFAMGELKVRGELKVTRTFIRITRGAR
jgi:hypothetical protein